MTGAVVRKDLTTGQYIIVFEEIWSHYDYNATCWDGAHGSISIDYYRCKTKPVDDVTANNVIRGYKKIYDYNDIKLKHRINWGKIWRS